ncbi:MAG: phosphocholine cytidylyltransferase family protein [Clostridia bacterium]|nr:phosphocholine cytidylyltransferase family protein [Clostridia bacterium]
MHKVKRAIIMAAGTGSRMQPLTFTTPKPLIKVNGERMIDSVIKALHKNSITEIYVVVGHLKEEFNVLTKDFEGITLIENPYYNSCNNISSLYVAREHLKDVIILDGDQVIYDPDILSPDFVRSGYNAIWTDEPTNEWVLTVENDVVTACSRTGADKGWQLFSVSRWSEEDGTRLKGHLEEEFIKKENTQIYWDDVAIFCHPEEYTLGIKEMSAGAIEEIDTIEELAAKDASYKKYLQEKN